MNQYLRIFTLLKFSNAMAIRSWIIITLADLKTIQRNRSECNASRIIRLGVLKEAQYIFFLWKKDHRTKFPIWLYKPNRIIEFKQLCVWQKRREKKCSSKNYEYNWRMNKAKKAFAHTFIWGNHWLFAMLLNNHGKSLRIGFQPHPF